MLEDETIVEHSEHDQKGEISGLKPFISAIVGTGVISVLVAGAMSVSQNAQIAIRVAEQHGEELLMIRGELTSIREEMTNRTEDRYTGRDGARFEAYVTKRLDELEEQLDRIEVDHRQMKDEIRR